MISLTPDQQAGLDAFEHFLFQDTEQCFVLSGFSGCGKTAVIPHMVEAVRKAIKAYTLLNAMRFIDYRVCATTNQAALVISKVLNLPVSTIYSDLKISVSENHTTGKTYLNTKKCKVDRSETIYLIDEASYLNDEMLDILFKYRPESKFVFIGDEFQLPSVGDVKPPAFSLNCAGYHLSKIVRQDPSPLQDLVIELKEGVRKMQLTGNPVNVGNVIVCDGDLFQAAIEDEFTRPDFKVGDACVLAYHNRTVNEYSGFIREIQGKPRIFQKNDTAIVGQFIDGLKPGQYVHIVDIKPVHDKPEWRIPSLHEVNIGIGVPMYYAADNDELRDMLAWMADQCKARQMNWAEFFEFKNQFIDLRDPQALTVHKSQGSTFRRAFLDWGDINGCRSEDMIRRLRYVGAGRAAMELFVYV